MWWFKRAVPLGPRRYCHHCEVFSNEDDCWCCGQPFVAGELAPKVSGGRPHVYSSDASAVMIGNVTVRVGQESTELL